MKKHGKIWFEGLKKFIADCRVRLPIVAREELSVEEEAQCQIVGGSLITWLEKWAPRLVQERAMLAKIQNWEIDPFLIFASNQPGLAAAREILEKGPESVAFLFPDEFADWLSGNPDPGYRWHVHTWSFFAPLDVDTAKKATRYPIGPGESYWLHREGTMFGPLCGRGGDHLWKWDGQTSELLEECINQWVS
jgi:hypothetical protein